MLKRKVVWILLVGGTLVFIVVAGSLFLNIQRSLYNSGVGIFW